MLADQAALPRKTIYNTEKRGNASARTIEKLAIVLGVPVEMMTEPDPEMAEAAFLASQVNRLGADARQSFFRAIEGHLGHRAERRQTAPPVDVAHASSETSDAERFAAEEIPTLLRRPKSEWHRCLEEEPRYKSLTCAWKLLDEADRMTYERPREAIEYYRLALFIAEEIGRSHPISSVQLRVRGWKELAWTLREVGEYTAAESALDTAEHIASFCIDREKQLARVKLSRAILRTSTEHLDEALVLVREARATFSLVNDPAGYEMAVEQEAHILLRRKDGSGAVAILEGLETEAADDATKGRLFLSLAYGYRLAGSLTSAQQYLEKAIALHEKLGWTHILYKDMSLLGSIMAEAGEIESALETLGRASDGFRNLEDVSGAIGADLDRCEIEIDCGRADAHTFDRLRAAATYAIEKGLPQSQCRALLFLQRLGRGMEATHIRYVKDFIQDLETHPHRDFVPPEPHQ